MYNEILDYLDKIIPNPKCELNYTKDYELLIAVMLSAQTTDKRVNLVTEKMFDKYDSLEKLSEANIKDIEKFVYTLGNYSKKSRAVIEISKSILKLGGYVPNDRAFLESLPMVGRKTVSVVLSELFNEPNIAVDTHVERTSKRLGLARSDLDVLGVERALKRKFSKDRWCKLHLQLVHFGRYFCTSKKPSCDTCGLKHICKYQKRK